MSKYFKKDRALQVRPSYILSRNLNRRRTEPKWTEDRLNLYKPVQYELKLMTIEGREFLTDSRECICKWRAYQQVYSSSILRKQRRTFIINSKGVEIKFEIEDLEDGIKKMRKYSELTQDPDPESIER